MSTLAKTAREWLDSEGRYVDSETYHLDCSIIGNSGKERFIESPRVYESEYVTRTSVRSETKDLRIGIYSHVAQFEPDAWRARYLCEPEYETDGRTTAGKAERAQFAADCIGRVKCDRKEYLMAQQVVAAIRRNKLASSLLDEEGPTERPIVWQHEKTGLWLKNKQDKFITARNWIVDLKTKTGSVKPEALKSEIQNRAMYRNADFYVQGHLALTGEQPVYLFLFVSKTTFEVALIELRDDWLLAGYHENEKAIRDMARARETGIYLAEHETQVTLLGLPAWAFRQDFELEVE